MTECMDYEVDNCVVYYQSTEELLISDHHAASECLFSWDK